MKKHPGEIDPDILAGIVARKNKRVGTTLNVTLIGEDADELTNRWQEMVFDIETLLFAFGCRGELVQEPARG